MKPYENLHSDSMLRVPFVDGRDRAVLDHADGHQHVDLQLWDRQFDVGQTGVCGAANDALNRGTTLPLDIGLVGHDIDSYTKATMLD
jgi:hypothetical protein